jgi:hypothetical protein
VRSEKEREKERAMARESFTLLNLTDSESESVPDLDLVLPAARKQIKRKVGQKMEKLSVTMCERKLILLPILNFLNQSYNIYFMFVDFFIP